MLSALKVLDMGSQTKSYPDGNDYEFTSITFLMTLCDQPPGNDAAVSEGHACIAARGAGTLSCADSSAREQGSCSAPCGVLQTSNALAGRLITDVAHC